MIGQTISHYKILEKLGEGGMGVVYKAQDMKLDRTVALKFLPHHLTTNEAEQARFLQEAKAASALNHPNVCSIHSIGEHEGPTYAGAPAPARPGEFSEAGGDKQSFIDMEFVEGQTLRAKIAGGPLKLDDAITYAIQTGDALHEAHSKGIVHRDIKCENIMVNTRNKIKVMDFGLAKLKGSLKLTKASSTVGTLSYMAPEQIQGGEVDGRSDIFSFGVVLFEMLTGHMPFRGEHDAAMMYSILNEEPEPLTKYLPEAGSELLHVINRALEKDPEDRYQTVNDMVIDLRRTRKDSSKVSRRTLTQIPVPQTRPVEEHPTQTQPVVLPSSGRKRMILAGLMVAVVVAGVAGYMMFFGSKAESGERLPIAVADFVNNTKETELDGLSGMLITSLEQSRRLAVLTRARMFDILKQMGKSDIDRIDENVGRQICAQADVNALVTASIRKFGKLYTIDLKVLDPQKNEYIFTAKEEGEGQEGIPAMLDRLSEKTRIGLKEKADEVTAGREQIAKVTTTNLEAYQHFFQGEQLINRLRFDDAEKELRRAVELDSTFGLAWYRLAYTLTWTPAKGQETRAVLDKAMLHMDRVPAKEQYLLRAVNAEQGGHFAQAVPILREMEKTYPDDKEMMYNIGDWSYHSKDLLTAATYLEKVLQVDPTFERGLQHLTWTYRDQGRYEKMVDVAKRYVNASGSTEAYQLLGQAYEFGNQFDAGLKTMLSARELYPTNYEITVSISRFYQFLGQESQAESELKALVQDSKPYEAKRVGYRGLANYYSYFGKYREALRLQDKRIEMTWNAKDTALAAQDYVVKAWLLIDGLKDVSNGWKEAEKSFPYQDKIKNQIYWGNLSLIYIYNGDYAAADTIFKDIRWWQQLLLSVRYSLQKDCANAELFADSAENAGVPVVSLFARPPLTECQLEAGLYDKALASMMRLRSLKEAAGTHQYVKTFLLAGKIYEKKGDTKLAIENFERFLDIWKNADKDLPDYIDAKARLAKLKAMASK
jgi:serine/threonine protein kinase/tetratricopeptide (TPR) repeat protein